MAKIHYVYELVRTTPGAGATRYIGVRTAENVTPEKDEYWSSSERVAQQRAAGAKFTKKILKTFATREEAELYEAELHWQNMVGKSPHFYNVTSHLGREPIKLAAVSAPCQTFPRWRRSDD